MGGQAAGRRSDRDTDVAATLGLVRAAVLPRPGEPGNETWEGDSWRKRSGVNVWALMSVDAERGIAYLPFGAPAVLIPSLAIASLTISVNLLIDNLPVKIRDRSA